MLVHDELHRNQPNVVLEHELVRQVAGGIAHERHRAPGLERLMLRPHVVGFGRFERAPRACELKHGLGGIGVDVRFQQVARFQHDDRAAVGAQRLAHRGGVGQGRPTHHQLGAVAIIAICFDFGQGGGIRRFHAVDRAFGDLAFLDEPFDTVE